MTGSDAARLARRRLAIGAIESGSFKFAVGGLVHFWALFTKWTCEAGDFAGITARFTMYTLIALTAAETVGGLVGASRVEKLARRKRFVTSAGLMTHGAWVAFGLSIPFVPRAWLMPMTLALVGWRGFFDGLLIGPWLDLAARVVPPEERARFFSVRLFAGAIGLPLGGLVANFYFRLFEGSPATYWSLLFVTAGLLAGASDLARLAYPEPETPVSGERRARRLHHDLVDYFRVVLRDGRFLRLCVVTAVAGLAVTFAPFVLPLFGYQRLGMSESEYGAIVLLLQLSPIAAFVLLPRFVRRLGWRGTYALLLLHFAVAYGLMVAAAGADTAARWVPLAIMSIAFVLMGLGSGWGFADANTLYGIASSEKRPSYIVVSRTISNGIAMGVMCLAAGLGKRGLPYGAIFMALAAAFLFASLFLVFALRTREEDGEAVEKAADPPAAGGAPPANGA